MHKIVLIHSTFKIIILSAIENSSLVIKMMKRCRDLQLQGVESLSLVLNVVEVMSQQYAELSSIRVLEFYRMYTL